MYTNVRVSSIVPAAVAWKLALSFFFFFAPTCVIGGSPANDVYGQSGFNLTAVGGGVSIEPRGLHTPRGLWAAAGVLWVCDSAAFRVLHYPNAGNAPSTEPDVGIGQSSFSSLATAPSSLVGQHDSIVVSSTNIFVSDSSNNRVLMYPVGASFSTVATRVYGKCMKLEVRASQ